MSDPTPSSEPPWEDLAVIGSYSNHAPAQEHALVILAMRLACWVHRDPESGLYLLLAEPEDAGPITREINAYEAEQIEYPPGKPIPYREVFLHSAGWGVYAVWATVLVLVFLKQQADPTITDRFASSSRDLIGNGQWWRPLTALFLHGDIVHLMGNLLSGLFLGTMVSRMLGPIRGWLLILASGVAGNLTTSALTWPEPFTSIGASTAVFGALGILVGLGCATMLRLPVRMPWLRMLTPLLAGVVLLGWMGGSEPGGNTDVFGHVFGFSAGLGIGILCGYLSGSTVDASRAGTSMEERREPT